MRSTYRVELRPLHRSLGAPSRRASAGSDQRSEVPVRPRARAGRVELLEPGELPPRSARPLLRGRAHRACGARRRRRRGSSNRGLCHAVVRPLVLGRGRSARRTTTARPRSSRARARRHARTRRAGSSLRQDDVTAGLRRRRKSRGHFRRRVLDDDDLDLPSHRLRALAIGSSRPRSRSGTPRALRPARARESRRSSFPPAT